MGPTPPNRPPDVVNVVRRIKYSGEQLFETMCDQQAGDDDVMIGLSDIIDLALDYAAEDINNATFDFELIAVWCDEHGNEIDAVVYDNKGCPIEWTVNPE